MNLVGFYIRIPTRKPGTPNCSKDSFHSSHFFENHRLQESILTTKLHPVLVSPSSPFLELPLATMAVTEPKTTETSVDKKAVEEPKTVETKESTESPPAESTTEKADAKTTTTSLPKDENPSETNDEESSKEGDANPKKRHIPTQQPEDHPSAKKIAVEAEGDSKDNAEAAAEPATVACEGDFFEGEGKSEDDDFESEDDLDGEDDFEPYFDAYPEAKLVSFELMNPSTAVEQEVENLHHMKSKDDDFKMKLHDDEDLKLIFILMYKCKISYKDLLTSDESKKQLQEIENGLVHRLVCTVRQRRLVTRLEKNKGSLVNSKMSWKDATFELDEVSKILWVWHTPRLLILSKAVFAELHCGMENDNFEFGLRRILTQQLNGLITKQAVVRVTDSQVLGTLK
jgi:hypothetical protein